MPLAAPATQRFAIRLEAAGACPFTSKPLPTLAETFTVEATDRRAAYRAAFVKKTIRLAGQTLHVFVDGAEELA